MSQEFNNPGDSNWQEGRYTNYFKVGHNAFEFLIDFGQFYPEEENAQLHTRIIASPNCVKALLETLQESIEWFERDFGPSKIIIPIPKPNQDQTHQPGDSSR